MIAKTQRRPGVSGLVDAQRQDDDRELDQDLSEVEARQGTLSVLDCRISEQPGLATNGSATSSIAHSTPAVSGTIRALAMVAGSAEIAFVDRARG